MHSELSCTRQDGEVPATVTQLLPKCCSASLATCQGAGSGSSSGYNCSTNIINSSTWLVASSHPLPGAAQEQYPLAWVTHLSAWFQVKCRCFEPDLSGTASHPEVWWITHHIKNLQTGLWETAHAEGSGVHSSTAADSLLWDRMTVLSASVSPSVKQRSKCLVCLKARGVNRKFFVRSDLKWCLWFLCQTPGNFRFRHCREGPPTSAFPLSASDSHDGHFAQVRGKTESTQLSWSEHRSPRTCKAQLQHWRLSSGMCFNWLITSRDLSLWVYTNSQ